MSGYRPGYSEEHSPYYLAGVNDGLRDAELMAEDPPQEPVGMDATRDWSGMYRRGYQAGVES